MDDRERMLGLLRLLSVREREVMALRARGMRQAAIARRLSISVDTVKRHLSNIYKKLELVDERDEELELDQPDESDDNPSQGERILQLRTFRDLLPLVAAGRSRPGAEREDQRDRFSERPDEPEVVIIDPGFGTGSAPLDTDIPTPPPLRRWDRRLLLVPALAL